MQRAVKGIGRAVRHSTERRVAVAEIVSAAENHNHVCVLLHFAKARTKIFTVVTDIRFVLLPCNSCAAYAVISAYRAVFSFNNAAKGFIGCGRARSCCNTVAQKVNFTLP